MKSTVVVPVVSAAALQRMLTLTANSEIDNVLLEWVLICELLEIGELEYCLPILLGEVMEEMQPDVKFIKNLFVQGVIAKLPDIVCKKVVSFVENVLADAGKTPSKPLYSRTVRGTVETIIKALGVLTWDISSSHGCEGGNVGHRTAQHAKIELKKTLFTEVVKKVMVCVEKAEPDGKSKVSTCQDSPPIAEIVARTPAEICRDAPPLAANKPSVLWFELSRCSLLCSPK
jgi:hypothetical protein